MGNRYPKNRKKPSIPVRPIRVEGDLAYIPLTKGHVAIIDRADVPLVERWNWTASESSKGRVSAYRRQDDQTVLLHRLIMSPPDDRYVDHISGDALDNRRENLRFATHAQNIQNQRRRRGRALPRGVSVHTQTGRFVAQICVQGERRHIGIFHSVEDAAAARGAAELKYFGEFAPRP